MMEYKRFISYLYRYEGEQKERNAGFVRLEVRNRQCRIRIFMNHLPAEEPQAGEAWVFRQEGGKLQLTPLGAFAVKPQETEACFVTQADNFLDTGLPVMAYCGLAVFLGESGQLYLTAWDDSDIDLAELRRKLGEDASPEQETLHRNGEMIPAGADISETEPALEDASGSEEEQTSAEEKEEPETQDRPEIQERPGIPVRPEAQEDPETPAEAAELAATEWEEEEAEVELIDLRREEEKKEPFRTLPPERFQVISLAPRAGSGAGAVIAETPPQKERFREENKPSEGGPKNGTPGAAGRLWRKMLRAGVRMMQRYEEKRAGFRAAEEAAETPRPAESGEREETAPEFWERLAHQLPHQLLFGPEDEREFLRLSLQDIGRLPRGYWDLGKNPFLLHGYGRGRHLLLMSEQGTCYLGVPGEDRERDRLAAELADFTRILETKGGFYWLRELKE